MGLDSVNNSMQKPQINWGEVVNKIKDADKAGLVSDVKFDVTSNSIVFSVSETNQQIAIEVPDIDAPNNVDQSAFASLLAKLKSGDIFELTSAEINTVQEVYSEVMNTPLPEKTGKVLFDLYALIALMLEAAQSQRDAAAKIRLAENQAVQQSIQNQADQQRDAAVTGMIATLCVCVIQVAAQGFSMAKSMQAGAAQQKAMQNAKVDVASQNLTTAKAEFDTANGKLTQMKEVQLAQQTVAGAKENLQTKANATNDAQARLQDAEAELTELYNSENVDPVKFDAARAKVETTKTDFAKAKAAEKTAKSELTMAEKSLFEARETLGDDIGEVTDNMIQIQENLVADKKTDVQTATNELGNARAVLESDPEYLQARADQSKWDQIGGMIKTIGDAAQGIVRGLVDIEQSEATREGAQTKKAEEELEQIKDLYAQSKDVIKAAFDLFSAICQAESSSMQEAIQA